MRVCFISFEYPPNIFGGVGIYAQNLVRGLKDRGIDVCTITRGDETVYGEELYRIYTPDTLYWQRFHFVKKAISLIRELNRVWKFDLVHFNGSPYPITERLKVPMVSTFHCTHFSLTKISLLELKSSKTAKGIMDLVLRNPLGSLCDIMMARISDEIICPSPSLAKDIRSYCFVNERKIHVILNGFDPETFDGTKLPDAAVLGKYGIENGNFLLYIGRLSSLKGVQYLIEAFKSLKKDYRSLKLVIAGNGNFESYLTRFSRNIKNILFVGFVDSLSLKKLLYEACVAVVVPSLFEVLPMTILEAMACSKPIVASDVGGISLMIEHGKNGFLVRPRDSRGLENCIRLLYKNPSLREEMGRCGRRLLEENFSVNEMVHSTLKVYKLLA